MAESPQHSTEPRRFGVLLVTGGHTHQENYARAFAADPRCRLVGLTDEDGLPERRRSLNLRLAQELNVPLLDDFDAAIHRDDVDIVCLCPEPERRARLTIAAAQAGKHVYVDKPLCAMPQDAAAVVAAVQESGVLSQMFSLVRSSIGQRAKRVLDSGRLGRLIGLHCEMFFAKGWPGTADLSVPRVEQDDAEQFTFIDSKRELFCVGLYPLVLFQWLTGGRFTNVAASTGNYFFKQHQQHNVEDFASLLLKLEGTIDVTIMVGRTGWKSHASHGVHQVHLIGTDDAVTIDAFRPRLEIWSDSPAWQPGAAPHPEDPMGFWSSTQQEAGIAPKSDWWPIHSALQSDAAYFIDCVEQNCESDVPASMGAHAVEVIHAAYR